MFATPPFADASLHAGLAESPDMNGFECLGHGLAPIAEEQLRLAGLHYHDEDTAVRYLDRAESLAPGHAAVYIGRYRFFFYKNRLKEALAVGAECLKKAGRDLGCGEDWRSARPEDAPFGEFDAIMARFFLFTLKGYAYLNMRLGNLEEGRAALMKLLELDSSDKIGARVLLDVLERQGRDDENGDGN